MNLIHKEYSSIHLIAIMGIACVFLLAIPEAGTAQVKDLEFAGHNANGLATEDGTLWTAFHDSFGRMEWQKHSSENTSYQYDSTTGQLRFVYLPGNKSIEYQYDSFGRKEHVKDADGKWTDYEWDDLNRPEQITYPADSQGVRRTEKFMYKPVGGDLKTYTDRAGRTITFEHDAV